MAVPGIATLAEVVYIFTALAGMLASPEGSRAPTRLKLLALTVSVQPPPARRRSVTTEVMTPVTVLPSRDADDERRRQDREPTGGAGDEGDRGVPEAGERDGGGRRREDGASSGQGEGAERECLAHESSKWVLWRATGAECDLTCIVGAARPPYGLSVSCRTSPCCSRRRGLRPNACVAACAHDTSPGRQGHRRRGRAGALPARADGQLRRGRIRRPGLAVADRRSGLAGDRGT